MPAVNSGLHSLAALLPGHASGSLGALEVRGLCLDSRRCAPGDLFLAVPGTSHDGRRYMAQAASSGCAAIAAEARGLSEFVGEHPDTALDIPVLGIDNLSAQLSAIAGRFYGDPSRELNLIGITGTNGKTTCAFLLAQLLDTLGRPSATIGTLGAGSALEAASGRLSGTGMTTPDALQTQALLANFVDRGIQAVTMEVSSHSLSQSRVAALHFDTAILTNLSRDHLDYHETFEAYGAAKARLFEFAGLKTAIINRDDPFGQGLLARLSPDVNAIAFSTRGPTDVWVDEIRYEVQGLSARIHTPWGEGELSSCLLGEFNLANLLAVVAAACAQGLSLAAVLAAVADLKPVPGRLEVVSTDQSLNVVIDYAHTPDALSQVLAALRRHTQGRLWCVFGCGGDRDPGKRPEMGRIAEQLADCVIITSDNPRSEPPEHIVEAIRTGLLRPEQAQLEVDRRAAIRLAITGAQPGDTVLIAGKGHEEFQQIGLDRLPFSDGNEARLALNLRRQGGES
ncbi:MAG: UDP-N-acetylmuramoyl-L-alanyl-D-glutamate--2,6-diaminopimelate ligase [Porticoccaceae bacterium]|nr:UDP-N-acetylmuramoyl-L-alanyl-D-glutamate--2,6-diaminopimelate ligase [Porticoccaceae bacterium]